MQLPLSIFIPESNWRPPVEFPSLGSIVSLDIETHDPELLKRGPGFLYGLGEPVGIALANDKIALYLPFGHKGGDNLPRHLVLRYVQKVLDEAQEVVMANASYDLGWLHTLGLRTNATISDVQVAEALIDEERSTYKLDALSQDYLHKPKDEALLLQAAQAFGVDPKGGLHELPARLVGPYAEFDARSTFDIYQCQLPILEKLDLMNIWRLEQRITPLSSKMSLKGVPVNLAEAQRLNDALLKRENEYKKKFQFDIWSPPQVAAFCQKQGVTVPKTDKGNLSADKLFMKHTDKPEILQLLEYRELNRIRKVFLEDSILKGHYNGRIHCEFIQVARDDGGTRSGRFSCRNPNLQQVPKRSSIGKQIRTLYTSESDSLWAKCDYSSQEPRLQVHYALLTNLPGATDAAATIAQGIKLYTFFEKETGLDYDTCKMLCLGIGYGMGKIKMADTLGVSTSECEEILKKFNNKAPFLRMLFDNTMSKANRTGFIRTILGRRCNFDWWTPSFGDKPIKCKLSAEKVYPNQILSRAFTSKALNRLIQGSAADQTKKAMIDADAAGIDLRLPVHDEINAIVPDEKTAHLLKDIMEQAVTLKLPVVGDLDIGTTWK